MGLVRLHLFIHYLTIGASSEGTIFEDSTMFRVIQGNESSKRLDTLGKKTAIATQ